MDEETFARVFGKCEWAVLFVLARGGKTYARLRFNIGPGGEMEVPVYVDFGLPFRASDHASWEKEYERNICHVAFGPPTRMERLKAYCNMPWNEAWLEELDAIESEQEARVLQAELDDELADCLVEEREVGL